METYTCSMYVHVQKDNIHVSDILRQPEMIWKKHEGIRQNIVHFPMSLPKLSVGKILRPLVGSFFANMLIIVTEQCS
jgi:hypothetical protein